MYSVIPKLQVSAVGTLERRILEVSKKKLKVVKPGSKTSFPNTEVRGSYAPPFHVSIQSFEEDTPIFFAALCLSLMNKGLYRIIHTLIPSRIDSNCNNMRFLMSKIELNYNYFLLEYVNCMTAS